MKQCYFAILLILQIAHCPLLIAQDTTCGIVWYPAVQLWDRQSFSPRIALSGDDTVHVTWKGDNSMRLPYLRSVNGGVSFEGLRELLTDSATFWRPPNDHSILSLQSGIYVFFAGATTGLGNSPIYMMRSRDRGASWEIPRIIFPDTSALFASTSNWRDTVSIVYSVGDYALRSSTDAGVTWLPRLQERFYYHSRIALSSGTLHYAKVIGINFLPAIQYKRSYDLGTTWADSMVLSSATGNASDEPAIAADSAWVVTVWRDTKYGCLGLAECSIIGRQSRDNGQTFLPETTLTEQPNGGGAAVAMRGSVVAAVWEAYVGGGRMHIHARVSRDGGETWCPTYDLTPIAYTSVAPRVAVSPLGIHVVWHQKDSIGGRFYVFYRRGVFLPTGVQEQPPAVPMEITLLQNYPNPFNPKTVISYQLSVSSWVTLKVYDVLGREVATLVSEQKQPGKYEIEWDAEGAPGGVYLYRLSVYNHQSGLTTKTRKMILLR